MATRYKANSAGFRAMAVGPEVRAATLAEAEKARGIAEGLAQDFWVSGEYLGSFDVHTDTVELETAFGSHPVAAGILENTSDHAAAVEWGNRHDHKAHRVFGRTAAALGNG